MGAVHGLAGSGALTALVVTTLPSTVTRLGYLMLFGVGSTVGMAALSGLLGWPIARLGGHPWFARTVSLAVGMCLDRARFGLGLSVHRRCVVDAVTRSLPNAFRPAPDSRLLACGRQGVTRRAAVRAAAHP